MNPILIVLAILLLIGIVPERHSQKAGEKATLKMEMQTMPEKETVKSEENDYSDNDYSIYWYVIDVNSL